MTSSIAVTGCGWVSPRGIGRVGALLSSWAADEPTGFTSELFAAVSVDPDAERDVGPHGGPGTRLTLAALAAARVALQESGLDRSAMSDRVGVHLGTAFGGHVGMVAFGREIANAGARFVSPLVFPETVGNFAASSVARLLDVRGPNQTVCAGSDSGLATISESCRLLATGCVDAMIAVGADVLVDELASALARQDAAVEAGRSISGARFSEGACGFVLERIEDATKRGAAILAVLRRSTASDDGASVSAVSCRGVGTATGRALLQEQLASLASIPNDAPLIAADVVWGESFGMGSAAQIALAVAAFDGHSLPIVDLRAGAVVAGSFESLSEKPAEILAIGGRSESPSFAIRVTRLSST